MCGQLFQVQSCAKCLIRASQHQHANAAVLGQLLQQLHQRLTQRTVQCVHDLGPIQGHRGDAVFGLLQQKNV